MFKISNLFFAKLKHRAVDQLEELFLKLDELVYRIEPIDYSKEIIFASIAFPICFSIYYVYKFMKVKYFIYGFFILIAYMHEYYYLLLAKQAEMRFEMRKLHSCRERSYASGFFAYIFSKFFSPITFQEDTCNINEDYLYIDAVFKINPFLPLFTVFPKLFSESIKILFSNFGLAFKLFSTHLPLFHVYPFLIIFLILIILIVKLIFDWNIAKRKVDADFKLKLSSLADKETPMIQNEKSSLDQVKKIKNDRLDNNLKSNDEFNSSFKTRILKRSISLDFIPDF